MCWACGLYKYLEERIRFKLGLNRPIDKSWSTWLLQGGLLTVGVEYRPNWSTFLLVALPHQGHILKKRPKEIAAFSGINGSYRISKILCVLLQAVRKVMKSFTQARAAVHLGLLSAIPLLAAFELMCIFVGDEAIPLLSFSAAGSVALPAMNAQSRETQLLFLGLSLSL